MNKEKWRDDKTAQDIFLVIPKVLRKGNFQLLRMTILFSRRQSLCSLVRRCIVLSQLSYGRCSFSAPELQACISVNVIPPALSLARTSIPGIVGITYVVVLEMASNSTEYRSAHLSGQTRLRVCEESYLL